MRSLRSTLAAAVALSLVSGAASAQFSNAYIFGDSLSDAGQYGARFTTNPGLTFPMYLAERYGLTVTPSFTGRQRLRAGRRARQLAVAADSRRARRTCRSRSR